jgi:LysR family glycine cleavage system transcriptional activator
MDPPRRTLPPLSAIRAFEAAARLGSFTRAAEELGMTQAAVSYQVKLLEGRLDAALFHRSTRKVTLTETGRRLANASSEAFGILRTAYAAAAEESSTILSVSTVPTLASNWLVPRLGSFQFAHPAYAVRLDTSPEVLDLAVAAIDIGIRTGSGDWPGCEAHRLFPRLYTPLCCPSLIAEGRLRQPADLLKLPLFGPESRWREWFLKAGIADPVLPHTVAHDLPNEQFEVTAAVAQGGAALGSPYFFIDDVAAGRLERPFPIVAGPKDWFYFLVHRKDRRNAPKIRAFRTWILAEAEKDLARCPIDPDARGPLEVQSSSRDSSRQASPWRRT